MEFAKYQGAGNDFVIIDARTSGIIEALSRQRVRQLCDRRFGIGADGLMTLEEDLAGQEFYMRYWNADGAESTMCGNGGRCIALFAEHLGIGGAFKKFNSVDGLHSAEILDTDGDRAQIRLGMIDVQQVTEIDASRAYFVNTGSPHYVEFVKDVMDVDVRKRGAQIRHDSRFESIGGVNVNFVEILAPGEIRIRTFERGVEDETLACGTGATAAALASALIAGNEIVSCRVEVMGGELNVCWTSRDGYQNIYLTGPAEKVFQGKIK